MSIQVDEGSLFTTISKVYGIALFICSSAGAVLERFSAHPESAEFLFAISNCQERLLQLCDQTQKPQIVSSELNQLWAGVPILDGDSITRVVVLGPIHTSEMSKNLAVDYIHSHYSPARQREERIGAIEGTPVCPYVEFARLLSMLYTLIYGIELDASALAIVGLAQDEIAFAVELHNLQESRADDENATYPDYDFERHLVACIREGELEKLKRHLKTATFSGVQLIGVSDPVRRQKNAFIVLVTLVTRAAIDGGLNPQVAYPLSELYIQRVEIMNNVPAILNLTRGMLYDLTIRVSNVRRTSHYSRLVNDCCNFVDEHIRENLRVTDVAAFTGLNAHYVSQKFREETGLMSFLPVEISLV